MSKKLIAFFLALVMVLTMLAACGDEGTVYVPPVSSSNGGNKAPAVEEDGKLRIGISQSANISNYTDNDFTRWIEEQLDIELEFVYYSSSGTEAVQQFSLDCAAGKYDDMPDVIWGFHSMSRSTLGDLGEDGYVMDLTPYLNEEHFPNFMKALEKIPQRDKQIALELGINTDDGGYYGLPRIANEGIDGLGNMVFINEEWLENLGLEIILSPGPPGSPYGLTLA